MKYLKTFEEINLYHGSGNRFDKFDINKLSRNSGQDTYGWGIYFTDSEDVAKIYASEKDNSYVYHVKLHKGKTPENYDYLIFDKPLTDAQIVKIQKGLNGENMDIDISMFKNGFETLKTLWEYFYNKLSIEQQFDYGYNTAKKQTSLFLLKCGIDGLKYKMPSNPFSHEKGYGGYNYVIFDDKNINIENIKYY
jgi:hypothetical protein